MAHYMNISQISLSAIKTFRTEVFWVFFFPVNYISILLESISKSRVLGIHGHFIRR